MVGTGRFELPTPRTPSECSTRLSHVPTGRWVRSLRTGRVSRSTIVYHRAGPNFSLVMAPPHRYSVRHEDSCTAPDAVPGSQSLPGSGHEAHHPVKIRPHG